MAIKITYASLVNTAENALRLRRGLTQYVDATPENFGRLLPNDIFFIVA